MTVENLIDKHFAHSPHNWPNKEYKKYVEISIRFAISILNDIFTDGNGEIDDCCSKDDLTEEYLRVINELKQQL